MLSVGFRVKLGAYKDYLSFATITILSHLLNTIKIIQFKCVLGRFNKKKIRIIEIAFMEVVTSLLKPKHCCYIFEASLETL